ncbi:Endonuclease/exonuclease/phosphatase [Aspergillus pseudoustus]|uniref:Endonuclease/exonuclease/phosphatase n=1 Tax=Aspergillus pseudoustus TaxID=1810923 RepID=A0ABR4JX21_9EURO
MDSLQVYFITYNCALTLIDVDHFSRHFFDALPVTDNSRSTSPDLIVLSLQEIAPIAYAFLGGSFLAPYFAAFSQAVSRATSELWGTPYINVVADHSGMTALMIFARSDVIDNLSPPDVAQVGVGFYEIGNKGAVGARISYSAPDTPQMGADLTIVAAHLAPMEDAVARRNEDWRSIVERLVFSDPEGTRTRSAENGDESESAALLSDNSNSSNGHPGIFAPGRYLFFGGDLNYRTSDRFPSKKDVLRFPQADAEPGEPGHFSHLFKDDQLKREMSQSRCFHGLTEAPISFPPTYKYDSEAQLAARDPSQVDKPPQWKWASHRWPSWCDRILFLNTPPGLGDESRVDVLRYDALPVSPTSDHRAVALTVSIPLSTRRALDESQKIAPFPIDPTWARRRDMARKTEYVAGCLAYLGLTWEGNGLLLATGIGIIGAWLVIRSLSSV